MTPRIDIRWSMGSGRCCSCQQKTLYPLICNQPFASKVVPTAYANDPRLTGQADDNLVPCGHRLGRLSSGNRSLPLSDAGEPAVPGEANPRCCRTLSLFGPTRSPVCKFEI